MLVSCLRRFVGLHITRVASRPLSENPYGVSGPRAPISYHLMNEGGLLPHCADAGLQLTESHVRAAYGRGDLCVAAFDGDCLVGYQWLAFGPTPHIDGVWVDFNTSVRYGYKQFVRPEYRGRHIAAGLSTHFDRTCMQRGCLRAVSFIDLDNEASWRAASRLGNRTVGYAGYVSLFGLFLAFRTAGARVCGFRFYAPNRSQSGGRFASSAEMSSFTTD